MDAHSGDFAQYRHRGAQKFIFGFLSAQDGFLVPGDQPVELAELLLEEVIEGRRKPV